MPYYPKSRIVTQLNTNGNEFNLNGKSYIGEYFLTYDGKYYSGKPNSINTFQLEKIQTNIINNISNYNRDSLIFSKLNPNLKIEDFQDPPSYFPIITEQDYKVGKIIRYFAKQRGIRTFKIMEINKNTYDDINNRGGIYNYPKWQVTSLFWRITTLPNHIYNISLEEDNKRLVEKKDKTFFGIKQYLTDYRQFAR